MTGSLVSSAHVRRTFLDYFAGNSHTVVPSSPVVPPDDPTLLFVNSGMVPFKRTFLGLETRSYTRATSSQKCVRVSGKHNDLDEVGPSTRHNTFFEMLGNFSFGDYSKAEAIAFAFEFLTDVVGLDKDLLWPTIFETDDESSQLWQDITGIPESRITRLGKKDNFWTMGESGPCGPASEIVFDRGPDKCTCRRADCHLRHGDCDRWWEIWNLVFMNFDLSPDGTMRPLRRRSIDTGMGLERLTAVLQGADTVYETDVFVPILETVRKIVGRTEQDGFEAGAVRAIADHSRATAFIVADGVLPGNEGRGYVLRLLMRRAIRFGRAMGVERPFLGDVVEAVVQAMGGYYTELLAKRDFLSEVVLREEQRFDQTLASGLGMFENLVAEVKASGRRVIPGVDVFRLYDTFGFPHLLSRDVAREHGLEIDEAGFDEAMEAQRARARGAVKAGQSEASLIATGVGCEATQFVGYERIEADSRVLVLGAGGRLVEAASAGESVEIVLDQTPFYAEGGGQVGDAGEIVSPFGRIRVTDTRRSRTDHSVHVGEVTDGVVNVGDLVHASVDVERRMDTARNHTATHVLHKVLRDMLGEHAHQAGSLVAPDRLRFDFTHLAALTPEQITEAERRVNECIRANLPVHAEVSSYQEARASGALAIFGERYGEQVRAVCIQGQSTRAHLDDQSGCFSKELCGGTHVDRTGEIGLFLILSETGIGAGTRRIEAVTGRGAEAHVREHLAVLDQLARQLRSDPLSLTDRVSDLMQALEQTQQERQRRRRSTLEDQARSLAASPRRLAGRVQFVSAVVDAETPDELRAMADKVREGLRDYVVVLGADFDEKPSILVNVAHDLVAQGVNAREIARRLGSRIGGSGGGRDTLAQAGGRDTSELLAALAEAPSIVESLLTLSQSAGG